MAELKFYYFPGTCARVSLIALEETGAAYEAELVRFMIGEHKRPNYLAINPKGKVPTLTVDGVALTETSAIAQYLTAVFPDANLLPLTGDALKDALVWADFYWCSSTIHPLITRIRMPHLFAGPENVPTVKALAAEALADSFGIIEKRLQSQDWMLGASWSLVDAFVFWLWDTAVGAGFDPAAYPNITAYAARVAERPSVARALAAEGAAFARFAQEGHVPPPEAGR